MNTVYSVGEFVDVASLTFVTVKKNKPLIAKPMQTLLNDERVMNSFLLSTLEGTQMLKANSMVCIGVCGDIWQQDRDKLHKAYKPVEVQEDGWVKFEPKPESERDACQIACLDPESEFKLVAQWGTRQTDGSFVQTGHSGDYVLRSKEDPTDVWIVEKSIFDRTYE